MLRQEVYALDGTEESARPYTRRGEQLDHHALQPRRTNRHAVFFTHPARP